MKISDITANVYLKIEKKSGGLHISPVHLYHACPHLSRARSDRGRVVIITPEQAAWLSFAANPLMEGLRICESCRKYFENHKAGGVS